MGGSLLETVDHSQRRINVIVLVHHISLNTKTVTVTDGSVTPSLLAKSAAHGTSLVYGVFVGQIVQVIVVWRCRAL